MQMKVAQFINSIDPGGAESIVVRISEQLTKRGIDNCVFHFGNEWLTRNLSIPNFSLEPSPINEILNFGRIFGRKLKRWGITHLHSHLFGATLRGAAAVFNTDIHHVATQHDIYTLQEKEYRIRLLKMAAVFGNTRLISVSKQMEEVYKTIANNHLFCSLNNNIRTIYNGVDTDKFKPVHNYHKNEIIQLISVGRLEKVKNYSLLLRAISILLKKKKYSNFNLTIVGDGSQYNDLSSMINEYELHPWVTLLGAKDNIAELLNLADVFVLPSFSEGLSCSILEAMSCGLPILASDVGGNREIIVPNKTGWLFKSNDIADLVNKLDFLMRNKQILKYRGMTARKRVENHFSLNSMIEQYLTLYMRN